MRRDRREDALTGSLPSCAGVLVGYRKLIDLSPKKTWEGFIGGCVVTMMASWFLSGWLSRFKWMICPRTVGAQARAGGMSMSSSGSRNVLLNDRRVQASKALRLVGGLHVLLHHPDRSPTALTTQGPQQQKAGGMQTPGNHCLPPTSVCVVSARLSNRECHQAESLAIGLVIAEQLPCHVGCQRTWNDPAGVQQGG